MDWLRQNELPSHVKCSLDSPDFEGAASDFLQAKIVGLTRVLEAMLMLNASVEWEFVTSPMRIFGRDLAKRTSEHSHRA